MILLCSFKFHDWISHFLSLLLLDRISKLCVSSKKHLWFAFLRCAHLSSVMAVMVIGLPYSAHDENMPCKNFRAAVALDQDSSPIPNEHSLRSTLTTERAQKQQQARESFGRMKYGCSHYRRRCRIRAPCCREVFDCRHCHNEAKSHEPLPKKKRKEGKSCERLPKKKCYDLPLQGVESVICSICSTEQEVHQICVNCGVKMGEYFCGKCRFFDDDTTKGQFHCDDCGICRTGGQDRFFHCQRCGCCLNVTLENGHPCVEQTMHQNCPVCIEYLFDSRKHIEVLKCGHTMHLECFEQMKKHAQFFCPICSKSTSDMTQIWEQMDQEIVATPMPVRYRNQTVCILCNDCGATGKALFHVIGHKCSTCKSYNTRQIRDGIA